ncbi:MAG: endonuclease domain-containing protein [Rhodospirillaceae bacterium]
MERARQLRKQMTDAEKRLWSYLRTLKRRGFHFRKQAPIGDFIADFCCHAARLVIEVDGGQHGLEREVSKDTSRTRWLESQGYAVVRYWNNDVLTNFDGVVENIDSLINPTPTPPHRGEGF